jgi:hypothetical protein
VPFIKKFYNTCPRLATDYNAYNEWRQGWPGIVDLFKKFPSIQVDSADLVSDL